jgi:hypothetical protein
MRYQEAKLECWRKGPNQLCIKLKLNEIYNVNRKYANTNYKRQLKESK